MLTTTMPDNAWAFPPEVEAAIDAAPEGARDTMIHVPHPHGPDRLRRLREARGLSREQFAAASALEDPMLCLRVWEDGAGRAIPGDSAVALAFELGIDLETLVRVLHGFMTPEEAVQRS